MITLSRKAKKDEKDAKKEKKTVSIRDFILVKEVQEMEETMLRTCCVKFADANLLSEFELFVRPDEGYWRRGQYRFSISVPEEYNMMPPRVKCLTKIWHPNISVNGNVCLSLLRHNSIDGLGWAPTRRLKDVVWGLNSLFTDLLNFEDPLNCEAAEQYQRDKREFQNRVEYYISNFASR